MSEWMSDAVRYRHQGFGLMKVGRYECGIWGQGLGPMSLQYLVGLGFWHNLAGLRSDG